MKKHIIEMADVFNGAKLTPTDFKENGIMRKIAILRLDNVLGQDECFTLDNTIKKDFSQIDESEIMNVNLNKKIKGSLIQKEDLIIPIKQKNHKCMYINWSNDSKQMNFLYNTETLIIRVDRNIIFPKFMYYLLNTENILNYINEKAEKKTPNRVTSEFINSLELEIPPIEEQEKILMSIDRINRERQKIEDQLNDYEKNVNK